MEKVIVLLSTYNGEKYLAEQINSLLKQEGVSVEIIVRDDGSTDSTCDMLNRWQSQGVIKWYSGGNAGAAGSFMELLYNSPDAEYYAFCDQDDIWFPDKLIRGISAIKEKKTNNVPVLYFSAQTLIDEESNIIGHSIPKRLFTFGESLLRNPAAGCTMIFNKATRDLIIKNPPRYVYMHDMWLYMSCQAVNGTIIFDPKPSMLYRQHGNNVVGCKQSLYQKAKRRFKMFLDGKDSIRLKTCEELLHCFSSKMPERHVYILKNILSYRKSLIAKFRVLFFPELKTTSPIAKLALAISLLMNRY